MSQNKILVIGSSNTDLVIKTSCFPRPGETILGGDFFMNQGGKGANQAVTIARLMGDVDFICKTGDDLFRVKALKLFRKEGVDTKWILIDKENPSGLALIMVDNKGENSIVVAPGANANLTSKDIDTAIEAVDGSDYILMQLEIPIDTVEHVVNLGFQKQKKIILNPAPATRLPDHLIRKLHLITPNRIEAEYISGIKITDTANLKKAARVIFAKGVGSVVITLGVEGVLIYDGQFEMISAESTEPVDTTGAGDVFNGALSVALSEGLSLRDAVRFANKAAAFSIKRYGAIPSIPRRHEL